MGIENATYIQELYAEWPRFLDFKKDGAAHIRQIKQTLLNSFPSLDFRELNSLVSGQVLVAQEIVGGYAFFNNLHRDSGEDIQVTSNTDTVLLEYTWTQIDIDDLYGMTYFNNSSLLQSLEITSRFVTASGEVPDYIELGISLDEEGSPDLNNVTSIYKWYMPPVSLTFGSEIYTKTLRGNYIFDPQVFENLGYSRADGKKIYFWYRQASGIIFQNTMTTKLTALETNL